MPRPQLVRRPGMPPAASAHRSALAVALALPVPLAACDVSTVPATPPITPGVSGAPSHVNVILKGYLFVPAIVDLVSGETMSSAAP